MIKIDRLVDCCGCASCVQVCPKQCISFNEDKQGFRYPKVNKSICIECGSCERVCPMLKPHESVLPKSVYAAKNKDIEVRIASSSGGIFTILAEKIISEGGVVFGAKFDEHWEVVHDYAETIVDLAAFRGSKYLQSRIEDNYQKAKSFLVKGRKVLFSGTPCQIAGLKSYLQKDYDNLVCVDFVCHGVPSPKVWRRYLKEVALKSDKNSVSRMFISKTDTLVKSVTFRDKATGWKNYSFTVSLSETSGEGEQTTVSQSAIFSENAFMKAFLKNIILRPSCYACRFREGRSGSDITLGDFWGIDKLRPEVDDDLGVGLIMINSDKGSSICSLISADSIEMTYDEARKHNPSIYSSSKMHPMRPYFFWSLDKSFNLHRLIDRSVQYKPDILYRVLRKIKCVR